MISVPVLYLDNTVLFPGTTLMAKFNDSKSIHVINYCVQNDLPVFILLYPNENQNCEYGTLAKLHQESLQFNSDNTELRITLEGASRAKMMNIIQHIPYTIAEINFKHELQGESLITDHQISKIRNLIQEWCLNEVSNTKDREKFLNGLSNFTKIINYACFVLLKDPDLQQLLLESNTIAERFHILSKILIQKREKYDQAEFLNALKSFPETEKSNICH